VAGLRTLRLRALRLWLAVPLLVALRLLGRFRFRQDIEIVVGRVKEA